MAWKKAQHAHLRSFDLQQGLKIVQNRSFECQARARSGVFHNQIEGIGSFQRWDVPTVNV